MPQKNTAPKKPLTKSALLNAISDETNLNRREVGSVLDALTTQISKSLGRRGAGSFVLPGLIKIEKKKVPARKAPERCAEPVDESQSPRAQESEGHGLTTPMRQRGRGKRAAPRAGPGRGAAPPFGDAEVATMSATTSAATGRFKPGELMDAYDRVANSELG